MIIPAADFTWPAYQAGEYGDHAIVHGDCRDVLPKIPDKAIDLVLTDPPYGITACKWDIALDFEKLWMELKRTGKEYCIYLFTCVQPFTTDLINSNSVMFKYEWIWVKNCGANFFNLATQPFREHESILVFANKIGTYHPLLINRTLDSLKRYPASITPRIGSSGRQRRIEHYDITLSGGGSLRADGLRNPSSVLYFDVRQNRGTGVKHPTMKPVDLFSYFIATYSDAGDLILDLFLGSGTTLVAAKNLGRRGIGIEISLDYCRIAEDRLRQEVMAL